MENETSVPSKIKLEDVSFESHPDSAGDGLFHFSATYHGLRGSGFGTDYSRELALKKAFNELIERIYFHHVAVPHATTSSGFAAHDNFDKAEANAIAELIERDAFLYNWLMKLSPQWLPPKEVSKYSEVFSRAGCNLIVGRLAYTLGHHCVVSALFPKIPSEFGVVISSSANQTLDAAIQSTVYELRRALQWITVRRKRNAQIHLEVAADEIQSSMNHLEFYLNPNNVRDMNWFFQNGTVREEAPYSKKDIIFDRFEPIQTPWPISVVRARSGKVQDYFVGLTQPQKLNNRRLLVQDVHNWDLHPLP